MKCCVDDCREPAVCRYCLAHRPSWLPREFERPAVGPDAETADLRPEDLSSEPGGSGRSSGGVAAHRPRLE